MKNLTNTIKRNTLLTIATLALLSSTAKAQITLALDKASNYDANGWVYNSNGGFGLTPWMIWTNGDTQNGTAGHTISSAVADGFGNVDTDGKAFSMFGYPYNGNPQSVGYRWFTGTGATPDAQNGNRTNLLPGQSFSIDLAIALRNGYKGIDLLATDGQFLWNFGVDGDKYKVNQEIIFDNVYQQNSVFHVSALQVTANTFTVTITRNNESTVSGPFTGKVGGLKFYESSTASSDVLNKFYFNNLQIQKCAAETTWNGTAWSNGVPNIGVRAIIAGDYTSAGDLYACNLKVNNGANVTIAAGTTLTVENEITVAANAHLTVNSNANLVQIENAAVNSGNITVKRVSSLLYRLDYTLWSSPVAGQQLLDFSTNTSPTRFYEYKYDVDPTTGNTVEQYFGIDPNTNFDAAKGYLIRMPNIDTATGYNAGTAAINYEGEFTGVANNGIITKDLSTAGSRYTAVGNPYASSINVQDFFSENADVLDPGAGLYFWRKKNNTNASSYATLTKDAYVYNHATGGNAGEEEFGGEQWDELFNTTPEQNWVINPGQGFFVRTATGVANPKLTFNNSMRRGQVYNNQFFKSAGGNESAKSRMWLNLTGNDAFSQTAIVYSNTATLGIDAGRDGVQINSSTVSFYSIVDATNLTIQARPAFETSDVVPMGYIVNAAGSFTISMHRNDGVFANGQDIFVKDNTLGLTVNISDNDYTFTTEAGTFNNRFQIVYSTEALGTATPVLAAGNVIVYKQGTDINITTGTTDMSDVTVYDIQGRKLYSNTNINAAQTTISGIQAHNEVLIVQVNTAKGKVSKKIIF